MSVSAVQMRESDPFSIVLDQGGGLLREPHKTQKS